MGWIDDNGLHEGYVVPEFADGALGQPVSGGGVPQDQVIVEISYSPNAGEDLVLTRPAAEAIGWRILCDCRDERTGDLLPAEKRWRSPLLVRVPSKALEDLDGGRIYAADEDVIYVGDGDDAHEAVLRQLWRSEHVDERDALARITAARSSIEVLERELEDAVSRARAQGASWEAIGRAAGMARQSAHERWGKKS